LDEYFHQLKSSMKKNLIIWGEIENQIEKCFDSLQNKEI
jgi:hypothetical protein